MPDTIGHTRLAASALVTPDACLLYGLIQLNAVASAAVGVYEGRDATAGRLIITAKAGADDSKAITLPGPLYLANGLYVSLAANVSEVTLFWSPAGNV